MSNQVDVAAAREYELSNLTLALERAINLIENIKSSINHVSRVSDEADGSTSLRSNGLIASAVKASDRPGALDQFVRAGAHNFNGNLAGVNGDSRSNPAALTERELDVIRLVAEGLSNASIAEALFISTNTVARHLAGIFSKTESENRVQAANYAREHSLLD